MAQVISRFDSETIPSVESTLVVCESLDMFLDNLSRLTLEHDVEFNIELALRTTPISKTHYYMAPTELQKLKKEL